MDTPDRINGRLPTRRCCFKGRPWYHVGMILGIVDGVCLLMCLECFEVYL